jgi:glycosyltransferase involved in cell wall biosynthesis
VHLGNYSINDFKTEYPSISPGIEHIKINHGHYLYLKNNLSRIAARHILNISEKRFVILVFGSIRSKQERKLAISSFQKARIPKKTILFNRWQIHSSTKSSIWNNLKNKIIYRILRLSPKFALFNKFTKEDDIQVYLNAADVLFIPRMNTLNSGNLFLGLSFGLPIIGPDTGNLTEFLTETNNIAFNPEERTTVITALEKSFMMKQTDGKLRISNMQYTKTNCDWDKIAQKHIDFYNIFL